MLKSVGLLLTFILIGVSVSIAVYEEIQYRRDLKKLKEIAKKLDEIEIQ